jgi:hypothetical protein
VAAWANDLLKQAGQKLSAFDTGHRGNLEAGGARPMPLKAPKNKKQLRPAKLIFWGSSFNLWFGLREYLQETLVFTIKYRAFL